MRAIWGDSIAFGLVNVPVKAYGATRDRDVDLRQVHDADGGRIRFQRKCEKCGTKIPCGRIDKAFDDGERTVVPSDEDIEALPAEKSREIDVVQCVPGNQIDPIMLERSYYLSPDSKSPKACAFLRRTLEGTHLTAVVKFTLRQKTRLGILRVRGDVVVPQGMLGADEVREADFAAARATSKISPQEMKMSAALVKQFTADFTPEEFEDEYRVQRRTPIKEELKQGDALDTDATFGNAGNGDTEEGKSGDVIDLMQALKRSMAAKGIKKTAAGSKPTKFPGKKPATGKKVPARNKVAPKKSAETKKKGVGTKTPDTMTRKEA